jgi:hypothetical protein
MAECSGRVHGRECGRWAQWPDLYVLPIDNLIQVLFHEARDLAFNEGLTLCQLLLETFGVASGSQCLSVPVLLVALCSGGVAGCTSWMLGIALDDEEKNIRNCRWKLPSVSPEAGLAFIFLLLHLAQAS